MSIEYPDLADFLAIASAITGIDLQTLTSATKLDLADSALHAPAANFGGEEFYPDFCDKAAVLLVRLAKNRSSCGSAFGRRRSTQYRHAPTHVATGVSLGVGWPPSPGPWTPRPLPTRAVFAADENVCGRFFVDAA